MSSRVWNSHQVRSSNLITPKMTPPQNRQLQSGKPPAASSLRPILWFVALLLFLSPLSFSLLYVPFSFVMFLSFPFVPFFPFLSFMSLLYYSFLHQICVFQRTAMEKQQLSRYIAWKEHRLDKLANCTPRELLPFLRFPFLSLSPKTSTIKGKPSGPSRREF